ncbi:MAG: hypothetical protein J6X16_04915 [Bacteroidales bacterium]|nr:hypothetical protein [Bacteroidales bacterium]
MTFPRRFGIVLRGKSNLRRGRTPKSIILPGWRCFAPCPGLPSHADLRPAYNGYISPLATVRGECRRAVRTDTHINHYPRVMPWATEPCRPTACIQWQYTNMAIKERG